MGMDHETLRHWVAASASEPRGPPGPVPTNELARLRRKVAEPKFERETARLSCTNGHPSWSGRGAGDRDRTGMASLEGWGSTIELHPRDCRETAVTVPFPVREPRDRARGAHSP